MAVSSVKQLWTGQDGEDTLERKRRYTVQYEVLCDTISDDAVVAGGDSRLPRLGDNYANDPAAIVKTVRPRRSEENPYLWVVDIEYDNEVPFGGEMQSMDPETGQSQPTSSPLNRNDNPTFRPPAFKFGHTTFSKVARRAPGGVSIYAGDGTNIFDSTFDAVLGKPPRMVIEGDGSVLITNSAGDPFDPPIEVEEGRLTIDITWSTYSVSMAQVASLYNAVNLTTWQGLDPRTCRVRAYEAQSQFENNVLYWQRHILIEVNTDTWDLQPQDRGPRMWVPESGTPDPADPATLAHWQNFKNPDGSEAIELLDGAGGRLIPENSPVYFYYRYFPEVEFRTGLGL